MTTTGTRRAGSHKATRKPMSGHRRAAVVAGGTAAGVLVCSTAAFAYWSTSGSGQGAASARSMQAPVISAGTASADLYPGATGTVKFSANNPNPFPITVTLSPSINLAEKGTCTTPALTFGGLSFDLHAGETSSMSAPITMGDSSSDCQGQTFTVNLTTSSVSK